MIFAALALAILFAPLPTVAAAPAERHLHIQASRFEYEPGVVHVNPGDRVTIELVAADKPGVFRFRCATTCGPLHPFMVGELRVGTIDPFWRAAGLMVLAAVAGLVAWRR